MTRVNGPDSAFTSIMSILLFWSPFLIATVVACIGAAE